MRQYAISIQSVLIQHNIRNTSKVSMSRISHKVMVWETVDSVQKHGSSVNKLCNLDLLIQKVATTILACNNRF